MDASGRKEFIYSVCRALVVSILVSKWMHLEVKIEDLEWAANECFNPSF